MFALDFDGVSRFAYTDGTGPAEISHVLATTPSSVRTTNIAGVNDLFAVHYHDDAEKAPHWKLVGCPQMLIAPPQDAGAD